MHDMAAAICFQANFMRSPLSDLAAQTERVAHPRSRKSERQSLPIIAVTAHAMRGDGE
jgi:hypothetical protein